MGAAGSRLRAYLTKPASRQCLIESIASVMPRLGN